MSERREPGGCLGIWLQHAALLAVGFLLGLAMTAAWLAR